MVTASCYSDDCIAATLTSAPARDGLLDLNSITSDGFTCIVDDAAPANITVFWEAWGGSDITVAATGAIAEPAGTGTQNYTVTGFRPGENGSQVVMLAGVQSVSAANTAEVQDSGLCWGAASSGAAADNWVIASNNDQGSAAADTDIYALDGECLAMMVVAGGNPNARAQLTAFGADNFTLNWIARGLTNRRYIYLGIRGGLWKAGNLTVNCQSGSSTATVSGLSFAPLGMSLASGLNTENTAGTSATFADVCLGSGSSTSSRRSMSSFS